MQGRYLDVLWPEVLDVYLSEIEHSCWQLNPEIADCSQSLCGRTTGVLGSVIPPSMLVQYPRTCFLNARGVLRGASEGCFPRALCSHASGAPPSPFVQGEGCFRRAGGNPSFVLANVPLRAYLPADPNHLWLSWNP